MPIVSVAYKVGAALGWLIGVLAALRELEVDVPWPERAAGLFTETDSVVGFAFIVLVATLLFIALLWSRLRLAAATEYEDYTEAIPRFASLSHEVSKMIYDPTIRRAGDGQRGSAVDCQKNPDTDDFSDAEDEEIANHVRELLIDASTNFADAFYAAKGIRCNVSIKIVAAGNEGQKKEDEEREPKEKEQRASARLVTICRDRRQSQNRYEPDEDSFAHLLELNTAFAFVARQLDLGNPGGATFFSNCLPCKPHYVNTSFEFYEPSRVERLLERVGIDLYKPAESDRDQPSVVLGRSRWVRIAQRFGAWRLPYRSAIVAAIAPRGTLARVHPEKGIPLAGILAVDSPCMGAFDKEVDVALVDMFADQLYQLLKSIYPVLRRSVHRADQHSKRTAKNTQQ